MGLLAITMKQMSHKIVSVISFVFLLLLLWMVPPEFQYLRGRSVLLKAILVALSLVAIVGGSIFFFLFTEKTHRRYPRHPLPGPIKNWPKNVFDIIFIFAGTITSNFLSPIYMLITNLLLIFVVTLTVLLTQTTEFGLLDLFVNIIQIFVHYYLDRRDFVPLLLSSAICGGLICVRNNPRNATPTEVENSPDPVAESQKDPVTSAGESQDIAVVHELGRLIAIGSAIFVAADSRDHGMLYELGVIANLENSALVAETRTGEILYELNLVIVPLTTVENSGAAIGKDSVGAESQGVGA